MRRKASNWQNECFLLRHRIPPALFPGPKHGLPSALTLQWSVHPDHLAEMPKGTQGRLREGTAR
eukprot:11176723-Alexandrium_andersonii.AAC.1